MPSPPASVPYRLCSYASSDSDIDLLHQLAPGARLGWAIEDLAVELEALLGRPVDLVARHAVESGYEMTCSPRRACSAA